MRYFRKFILCIALVFIFTILIYSPSYSQLVSISGNGPHNLGVYAQDVKSPVFYDAERAYYPNGHYYNELNWQSSHWIWIKNLVSAAGSVGKQAAWGQNYGSLSNYAVATKLQYILRYAPPSITIDGVKLSPPFRGTVDATIKSDVQVLQELTLASDLGGVITETSRSYANPYHNSYVLWDLNYKYLYQTDYTVGKEKYLPAQDLTCYIGRSWCWQGQQRAVWTYNASWNVIRHRYRTVNWHVGGIFPSKLKQTGVITNPNTKRTELSVSYSMGSDLGVTIKKPSALMGSTWAGTYPGGQINSEASPVGNATGTISGEFLNYAYCGHTTLYADKSATDKTDDIAKPKYLGRLDMGSQLWGSWPKDFFDWADQTGIQPPGWELGYAYSLLESSTSQHSYQPIGPYVLKENQEVKTIYATAIGGIDPQLAWYYGNEYLKWYRDGIGNFDHAKMKALIESGQDSLLQNLDRAYFCYSKNYNIPDPPPVPDIELVSGPAKITVKWGYPNTSYFKDPDTGVDDFKEWRVYKKKGNILVQHPDDRGNFEYQLVHSTTTKNETQWDDADVTKGEAYNYFVTAVDDGSQYKTVGGDMTGNVQLESSKYPNRTLQPARAFEPGKLTTDQVVIVPNPYSLGHRANVMNYTGYPDDIHFVNLPPFCTLKIYTTTGDLIKTIQHTSGSGQEIWSSMRTDWNQQPVSGVYILVVDNAKNLNKDLLPKKIYKFVIVR